MIFIITDNCPTPINPSNLDFACTKTLMRARKTICHQLLFRIVLPQFGLFTARQLSRRNTSGWCGEDYPRSVTTSIPRAVPLRLLQLQVTGSVGQKSRVNAVLPLLIDLQRVGWTGSFVLMLSA
ncbi:hypothetical protein CDAR_462601 [Caerostris darwini]|uniref:Uncharacterized protein n=1 Tax=Caerostris darwini TaxID=1538125 RepID=A0AAV4WQN4_9ARAC|nr:hypothetical protein CDAR_462601 [Caerostris darwini]